jgi:polyphenol oxidase
MHNWQWRTWEGLPFLTCSLIEFCPHGFFTQQFSPRSTEELTKVLLPEATSYRLKQVHGNIVLTPQEIDEKLNSCGSEVEGEGDSALVLGDGLITQKSQQAVWVASADCTPALIADQKTGMVGAVHAGWRGTAKRIIPEAIERMVSQGSKLENLVIAMGPAIAGEVYQVSIGTAAEVGASLFPGKDTERIVDVLLAMPNSPLLPDPNPGKVKLDVRRVNALQIENMGISPEQIAIAPYCTYQSPDNFFSYRRENLKKVQWSGIVSK